MARIPGVIDLRIAEPLDYPAFKVDVDRAKALAVRHHPAAGRLQPAGLAQRHQLLQPNFWLDPVSGVNYNVIAQMPQQLINSIDAIANIPLSVGSRDASTLQSADTTPAASRSCSATSRPCATTGIPPSSTTTRCSA